MYGPQLASTSIAEPEEWNEPCFQPPIDSIPSHLFMSVVGVPSLRENFASGGIAAQTVLRCASTLSSRLAISGLIAGPTPTPQNVWLTR